jgi:hypothetical protein
MQTPTPPPDSPDVGDEIKFVDELHLGDLCYFDRGWDGTWLVRRLDDLTLWRFDRPLLTLAPGDEPSTGRLRVVTGPAVPALHPAP